MRLSTLLIVWLVFAVTSSLITPPDVVSMLTAMVLMVIIFGLFFFAVSRFKSFKQTPERMKKVIVALVCLLSITTAFSALTWMQSYELRGRLRMHAASPDPNLVVR